METEILDQVLLPLADQFEAGKPNHWCSFEPGEISEYEKLRECLAELVAEGSVIRSHAGQFRFSQPGYTKYLHRMKALRTLTASKLRSQAS
jgi:hypothetical protein